MNLSKTLLMASALAAIVSLPAYATEATAPTAVEPPASLGAEPAPTAAPVDEMATPEPEMMPQGTTGAGEPAPLMAAEPETSPIPTEPAPAMAADPAAVAPTETAPTIVAEPEPAPAPEVAAEAPPVVKKKAAPAKLSALAKKYKLMDLDKDGNKTLSRSEFTADGFANEKVFNRYDRDDNGKLTNSEINAYASTIEANSKR